MFLTENDKIEGVSASVASPVSAVPIGEEQVRKFTEILQRYKTGKATTDNRIIASENWWKLRNGAEESAAEGKKDGGGFRSASGWLHNVIVSKHADAMAAFPEPNVLPRAEDDKEEAKMLSSIIPCILEQNDFEAKYSDVMWQKCKTGTGCYKIIWDKNKHFGLGDISIEKVNLLNVYWEPGLSDIQESRYFFHTELWEKDVLREKYPDILRDKHLGQTLISSEFMYDDGKTDENKVTVIDVYYRSMKGGRLTLQYCKYVGDTVLYATENEPELAERGLYDHCKYPYVFDALFPIEGSPCGYGFVDVSKNPQTEIDILKTSFVKNARIGSAPRYMVRSDCSVNEKELLDLEKPFVHVAGNLNDDNIKQINFSPLDAIYVQLLDRTIQELRETSGNTEVSTGVASSGVTAASAIAALQEASGKGSRDATLSSYRAFVKIVEIVIELIRQFYDTPRTFRITGEMGNEEFVSYDNRGIRIQSQGSAFGADMGYRKPVFDIKVSAQKKNAYTKVAQNELAIQFFQMGFFNPQFTDQALMCLEMMDFDGKDGIIRKVSSFGTVHQKLIEYMQMALALASQVRPELVAGISADFMRYTGTAAPISSLGARNEDTALTGTDAARQRTAESVVPGGMR